MAATIKSYQDLIVWQAAVELAVRCYELTAGFPKSELFGATSQVRRASTSIAANIAEGFGREGAAQFIQFLRISQGSLKELETHLIIAARVGLIRDGNEAALLSTCDEIGRMLRSLIRTVGEDH
jgi:four helix bundle protein